MNETMAQDGGQQPQEQTGGAREPYLIDMGQDREKEAVRRAFSMPMIALSPLLSDLDLSGPNWWAILEIPVSALTGDEGEIDILLGPLTTEWPPKGGGPLAGIEAKAACINFREKGRKKRMTFANRSWHSDRKKLMEIQLPRQVRLGIDKVSLLDIVVTPPSTSDMSGQAWMQAASVGSDGIDAANSAIERSEEVLPYPFIGHWFLGLGSVAGGSELWRGASGLLPRRHCARNPYMDDPEIALRRTNVQYRVTELLSSLPPQPKEIPLVTRYCQVCRSLHRLYFGGGEDPCPKEGVGIEEMNG